MSLPFSTRSDRPLSPGSSTVKLQVLSGGHFSLPEHQFVAPSSPTARRRVPSLCFLIQHGDNTTDKKTNIVFDLGLRRDVTCYSEPIRRHVATRQPLDTDPDVTKSMAQAGLTPNDINYVIYSHVHWDHVGEPRDFPRSTFIVGHESLDLLAGTSPSSLKGGHSFFEADLLDPLRTVELPDSREATDNTPDYESSSSHGRPSINFSGPWRSVDGSPPVLDVFDDGSLYIVDAPGHLPGHINLLARVEDEKLKGQTRWVYVAGDACHDRRILRGEKEIGEWEDASGHRCCIHADRKKAEETIARIRKLEQSGVEPIVNQTSSPQKFTTLFGPSAFHPGWSSLLTLDLEFFSASLNLASVPRRKSHLPPKDQALISLAVDSAATHLYTPGIRAHVAAALAEGATLPEILEVIELSSTLGIHACNIGVPLLVEVLKEEGMFTEEITRPYDERQQKLQAEFTAKRGYWHTFWEDFLRLDPEFFEAYLEFSSLPWTKQVDGKDGKGGALSPKMKELVYCAFDCAATHLYVPGLKLHMRNALGYGATPQEIVEVLEIATLLGLHTAHVAAPIIQEVVAREGGWMSAVEWEELYHNMSTDPKFDDLHKQLFDEGIKMRRSVVGDVFVDRALANGSTEFSKPGQELVTEWCWGYAWTRPGLEKKQRSLLNIGMLMALNRGPELGAHIRGARNNGLTELEIREAILHCTIYCGVPAGVDAMKIAERVLNEMAENGEMARELGEKAK
ncbi:metallo-hydrolase oxidoreductase [Podospora aff. communis PSN243]|uniref:Metallo-hydrolase oxidoreductase n=1 Tax=Podospora aff. communis PSN243 TaxID=3040156 RepID=A0AAV9GTC8_9PEZI|nr:metallo-hydrolase oxidoreductase [Podospora aff. communis PSN243]